MSRLLALLLTAVMAMTGCGTQKPGLVVSDARIGRPTGPNAALYLTATGGEEDRLVAARTDVAARVVAHETIIDGDGTMSMRPLDQGISLSAGESLALAPGGYHLMLVDVDELQTGASVSVTLVWENAGEMTVEAEVVEPDETMGNG